MRTARGVVPACLMWKSHGRETEPAFKPVQVITLNAATELYLSSILQFPNSQVQPIRYQNTNPCPTAHPPKHQQKV
ncbi:hypothetical protein BP00DRAFT_273839 [Aspergillus indologenus CBS 114.80]|uniref:Uncharacterized protein n=1 Tax=Aspergillus indologenus CBS 114.80 TaxID=1450541 RepID=A0A2V5IHU9_9EURO|nr:hypothetical protein BP00DRAFT_273839 [Aspergillus indologenus CBS 114.80]